jgi:hypothetical protein
VSRPALGPNRTPFKWAPRIKRPGCDADHSPPSSTEVKNTRSYNSAPSYVFVTWYLVKHRDNFTVYLCTISPVARLMVPGARQRNQTFVLKDLTQLSSARHVWPLFSTLARQTDRQTDRHTHTHTHTHTRRLPRHFRPPHVMAVETTVVHRVQE